MRVVTDDKHYKNIGDAIREKNGTKTQYKPSEMANAIKAIEAGGGAKDDLKALIERTSTSIYNTDVVRASPWSFYNNGKIKTVTFPNAASCGESSFEKCTELNTVNLANAGIIGNNAFKNCSKLTSLNIPNVYEIRANAFDSCVKLTSLELPAVTTLGQYAFAGCTSLEVADFTNITSIPNHGFRKSTNLNTLYLRNNFVVPLADVGAFYGVKNLNVYVPGRFVEAYQTDESWKPLLNDDDRLVSFLPIPGTEGDVNAVFFMIGYDEYRADKGMTWAEWCGSEYDTLGLHIDEYGWVMLGDADEMYSDLGRTAGTDIIQAVEYRLICP